MTTFLELLRRSPRKRVPLADLREHFFSAYPESQNSPDRGQQLLEALRHLEADGELTFPAAGSWERIGAPPLPLWISLRRESTTKPRSDADSVSWVPELGFWPELRPAQLEMLKPINEFLLRHRGKLRLVPIKERSLEIYGDEKRLDAMRSGNTLFARRLSLDTLGAFVVPLPLPYRSAPAPGKPVLVIENHDSYWSFGEWNQHALRYAAIVYGAGEAFRSSGAALGQVLHEVNGSGALYLGDMDPKGIGIPLEFNRSVAAGEPGVLPAVEWYEWLLSHGRQREKAEIATAASLSAITWLGNALGGKLARVWTTGRWIPQEALGFDQLQTLYNNAPDTLGCRS